MRIALTDGEMHYVDEGSGPPILFVHGTPTNSYEYRHLIAALSKRFRCIAPDHLGFGESSRPQSFAYTPEAHARVLQEFVERLDLKDLTLVVHDFGGPIGLPLVVGSEELRVRSIPHSPLPALLATFRACIRPPQPPDRRVKSCSPPATGPWPPSSRPTYACCCAGSTPASKRPGAGTTARARAPASGRRATPREC